MIAIARLNSGALGASSKSALEALQAARIQFFTRPHHRMHVQGEVRAPMRTGRALVLGHTEGASVSLKIVQGTAEPPERMPANLIPASACVLSLPGAMSVSIYLVQLTAMVAGSATETMASAYVRWAILGSHASKPNAVM